MPNREEIQNMLYTMNVKELREISTYFGLPVTKQNGGYYNKDFLIDSLIGGANQMLNLRQRMRLEEMSEVVKFYVEIIELFMNKYNVYKATSDKSKKKIELALFIFDLYEKNRWLLNMKDLQKLLFHCSDINNKNLILELMRLIGEVIRSGKRLEQRVKTQLQSFLYQNKIQSDLETVVDYVIRNKLDLLHVFLELEYLKKNPDRNKLLRDNSSNLNKYLAVDIGMDVGFGIFDYMLGR